ncbi:hypothetical protein ACOSP7_021635 [Xanthoceras sorbifolium]
MDKNKNSTVNLTMPCAACKLLRRRCTVECIFLPYFSPSEVDKFAAVHRVFGASNICKMLQKIPTERREDAVKSLVYEAKARLLDPVYGSVGMMASLQNQVLHLHGELEAAIAEAKALKEQLSQTSFILSNDCQASMNTHQPLQESSGCDCDFSACCNGLQGLDYSQIFSWSN